jgi:CelD/BcsL family acetyltransferase involved in cellulose biosynthesis
MKTRLMRVQGLSKDDEDAWRRLGGRALEPNPFVGPDFFLLSAQHFEGYADARVLIAQEGSEFLGVLPMAGIDTPRIPPRRVATVRGRPTAVSGLQTPLVDRTEPDQTIDALVGALGRAATDQEWPGIVLFDEIGTDGPVAASLRRVCEARRCPIFVKDSWERATVSRTGQWADPVERKRRREVGRYQRQLAKDAGAEVTLVDRTQEPNACEDFLKMESAGWKGGERGQAFARYPDITTWFKDWHARSLATSQFTLLSLDVGSVPIAMHYFVRSGEGLFCFRMAFDEAYAKYSPGTVLLILAMAFLYENTDAEWIDSATHKGNVHMLGILPERRALSQLLIGTGGRLDRAIVSALPAMTKLGSAKRRVQERLVVARSR